MSARDRKAASNRRNAQKSTGPRTSGGRQRSSLNATRHGLTARPAQHLVRAWYKIILSDPTAEPDPFSVDPRERAALSLAEAEAWLTAITEAERDHALIAQLEAADRLNDPPWPRRMLRSALSTLYKLDEAELAALLSDRYQLINQGTMDIIDELKTTLAVQGFLSPDMLETDRCLVFENLLVLVEARIEQTYKEPAATPPILRYLREAGNRRSRCLRQWIAVRG